MVRRLLPLALVSLLACGGEAEEELTCSATADADADGLDDCAEADLGLDPAVADTDGDGDSDGAEVACLADPLDPDQACYQCGWLRNDPGDLGPTGASVGDTLANLKMPDQCGEDVAFHDLAGSYHILFMTTEWCGSCLAEAVELRDRSKDFSADLGIEFSYIIALFQDQMGGIPDADVASDYADVVDARRLVPTLSDTKGKLLENTPYDGAALPGKCILTPEMEMLDCWTGHGDDLDAVETIRDHAGL